jgi:hypothetical protein
MRHDRMTLVRHDGLTQSFHETEVTMRESPALSPIALELLRWCADDFTELFAVRQIVKRELAVDDPQRERQAALSALDELITLDLISVRDEAAAEASTWDESATRTRTKLTAAWESSAASMGVGPWLYATAMGLALDTDRRASVATQEELDQ